MLDVSIACKFNSSVPSETARYEDLVVKSESYGNSLRSRMGGQRALRSIPSIGLSQFLNNGVSGDTSGAESKVNPKVDLQ